MSCACALRVVPSNVVACFCWGVCFGISAAGLLRVWGVCWGVCVATAFLGMAARGSVQRRAGAGSGSGSGSTQGRAIADSAPAGAADDNSEASFDSRYVAGLACVYDVPVRGFHQHGHHRLCRHAHRVPLR
jgi:hypothetical protein